MQVVNCRVYLQVLESISLDQFVKKYAPFQIFPLLPDKRRNIAKILISLKT